MADSVRSLAVVRPRAIVDLVALTKPRITAMAVIVGAGALLLADGTLPLAAALLVLLGIGLAVAGAGALNMYVERDVDALMARTAARPLPSGRLDPAWALLGGLLLALPSVPLLYVVGGVIPAALTAFSLFVYVLVYTPMKRKSPWALLVGAVPGAMPALIASSAVTHRVDGVGLALFSLVLVWQVPHFLAISVYREREYVAAGHRIVPAAWGMRATRWVMLTSGIFLAALGVTPWPLGVVGPLYGVFAAALGVGFTAVVCAGFFTRSRRDDDRWARRVFSATLVYQTAVFGALAVDRALG